MKKPNRKTSSYRLTAEAKKLLAQLANQVGISQTAQLELLIRDEMASRRGWTVKFKQQN